MLEQIRIVLVNTSHPGNIGSVARAMKTMGLTQLYLVEPHYFPHQKADELAVSATDILKRAVVTETLDTAIADCALVIGASARTRSIPWPLLTPRAMTAKIRQEPPTSQIAILFGREQSGLTNEELQRCHLHIQIPANPEYPSLNLAAAVQVIAYELRIASLDNLPVTEAWDYPFATIEEMEMFYAHLQEVLVRIDFLKMNAPRRLMTRLRRLFSRARLDMMEVNMLRGILAAVLNYKDK